MAVPSVPTAPRRSRPSLLHPLRGVLDVPLHRLMRGLAVAVVVTLAGPVAAEEAVDPSAGRVSMVQQAPGADTPDLSSLGLRSEGGGFGLLSGQISDISLVPASDLTQPPTSLWTRLRNGFGMPDLVHPAVRQEEDFYANRPDHLRRVVERSRRYLFHIVEVIERRGMPAELALLPIIESAYNPVAVSPARAAGMWQFIPSTGLNFGLRQNAWLDSRRDILLSTEAALDYLQKLYDMFGSWELALAAYNCGEGCVQRAIARNALRGDRVDFSSLQLPAETRAYVPKLQAVKNIIANPRQFNMTLADVPNEPYFGTVQVEQHMDVKVAARLAGMTVEEFVALNPAHNRSVINVNKLPTLLLPLDRMTQFSAGLRDLGERALASVRIYTPRAGEPLDQIARRNGVTLAALRRSNDLPQRMRAAAGDVDLLIPTGASAQFEEPPVRAARPVARSAAAPRTAAAPRGAATARGTPRPPLAAAGSRQPARPAATSPRPPGQAATARKATPPTPPARPTIVATQQGERR
ncbi:MAG: transglycosylase SLT domain-containing protein [Rhodocyclaceae bacterium]|nr:transglycosylase SLT domain-containing protein [Rhodocyclaceae bacterium]